MNKNLTKIDLKVLGELQKLSYRDELFYTKHTQKDIEKILNLKENTLHTILYKLKINVFQKRNEEFLNYFYKQDLKTLTLEKIKNDLGFKYKQAVSKKIRKVFGVSLEELKEESE